MRSAGPLSSPSSPSSGSWWQSRACELRGLLQLQIDLNAAVAGRADRACLVVSRSIGTARGHLDLVFRQAKATQLAGHRFGAPLGDAAIDLRCLGRVQGGGSGAGVTDEPQYAATLML